VTKEVLEMLETNTERAGKVLSSALAFALWVATAALGLYEFVLVRGMLFRIYARSSSSGLALGSQLLNGRNENFYLLRRDSWQALAVGNWALIPLALVWIALVVGGGEYHYRRVGQRSSWKLFGWTIAAEMLILVMVVLV
jgi:hypothetical protein